MADNLTQEQRSKTMSRIRRRDTRPEKVMRQGVWARGLRGYRLDDGRLPGRPDLAWGRKKVAVFVDGAFWHGHPSAFTPGKSGAYWDQKIARNMERDREAEHALRELGWVVLRFWDFEIKSDFEGCVKQIELALREADAARTTGEQPKSRSRKALVNT
jgi:DNA mismatch endonuclease (patch repair protein)